MFLIVTIYALFASTFTLGKEALAFMPPIFFTGIRMIIAGLLLTSYVWYSKQWQPIKKEHYTLFGVSIFFHIYLAYVTEFMGMAHLTSSKTCLIYNLSPFITALFAYFFFNEVMTSKKWLGLGIGFLAFLPTLMSSASATESSTGGFGFVSGAELLVLTAVVSSAIGWTVMRKLTREEGYSYILVNSVSMLFGGILALGTGYWVETIPSFATLSHEFAFWRALALLILIGNIICYNLYGHLLHKYSTTILSFFGFITPLWAALFGWLWLGETVDMSFFYTVGLIFVGLYIFYQEELKQGYILS